jgi:hypothetical protein
MYLREEAEAVLTDCSNIHVSPFNLLNTVQGRAVQEIAGAEGFVQHL